MKKIGKIIFLFKIYAYASKGSYRKILRILEYASNHGVKKHLFIWAIEYTVGL